MHKTCKVNSVPLPDQNTYIVQVGKTKRKQSYMYDYITLNVLIKGGIGFRPNNAKQLDSTMTIKTKLVFVSMRNLSGIFYPISLLFSA